MPSLSSSQIEHRFDMEAEPEPIPDDNHADEMSIMGGGDGSFTENLDVEGL